MWDLDGPIELLECDEYVRAMRLGTAIDGGVIYIDGLPQRGQKHQQFRVTCTVQPMGGKDLLLVPEGDRTREQLWLYQSLMPPISRSTLLRVNDIVLRDGCAYQVQGCQDWGSYAQARLMAVDMGRFAQDDPDPYGL
jgi:hypothetical protein